MLLLVGNTDKLQLVTSAAATVDVVASYMDASNAVPPVVQGDSSGTQLTAITTATTTDIVATPAASEIRRIKALHIRNKHATTATDVTVVLDRSATDYELHKVNLAAGEALEYIEGVGFFELAASPVVPSWTNKSTASQAFTTTDAYVTGSSVRLDALGTPTIGLLYDCSFDMAKTAGTGAVVVTVRVGTAGSTADTARLTFTMDAGTSAADTAEFRVHAMFRAVGASAVLQGRMRMTNAGPTVTGFRDASPTLGVVQATSGAFDAGVANSIIGISFNGSTAFAGTAQLVEAELVQR
jgi:hypothetical protein